MVGSDRIELILTALILRCPPYDLDSNGGRSRTAIEGTGASQCRRGPYRRTESQNRGTTSDPTITAGGKKLVTIGNRGTAGVGIVGTRYRTGAATGGRNLSRSHQISANLAENASQI